MTDLIQIDTTVVTVQIEGNPSASVIEVSGGLKGDPGGAGPGTVDTVNGVSPDGGGNVGLTADNIGDGTTNKAYTATEKTKLAGIATAATANSPDATLEARANHTGTQLASTVSDFSEAVDDRVAALLVQGTNVTLTYNDAAGTLTIASAGGGTWGSITGTLSSQSDLNTALGLKAPIASPTFTGTVSGVTAAMVGLGNVNNTSNATERAATAALTNKDLTGAGNTFPTFNQNTTGSAAKWTTARTLAGNSTDGSTNVAFTNKFIVQGTTDAGLSGAQFLGALGTGLVKNTTTTGVLSIATAGTDFYAPGSTDVAIADGGTGVSTLPAGILVGAGTGAITALTAPSGAIVGISDTQTLTNKRINPRAVAMTDGATITPTGDSTDIGTVTLAGNRTMAAPTGTPVEGQTLVLRITQDGTGSRTLTWNAIYLFPTGTPVLTTTAAANDSFHFRYNNSTSKWVLQSFVPSAGLTSDFSFNTHKGTNAVDPVSAQDVATKNYVDTNIGGLLDSSDLPTAVPTALAGITLTIVYSSGWPTLDSGLSANAGVAWLFSGGDDAHAPPSTTGPATWVHA